MQKIFYNAKIVTFDKNLPTASAFLTNDENIVFVGSDEDVLTMKTDDTLVFDMGGKTIFPSFYDTNSSIYDMIENRLKNAKKDNFLENNAEIDLNYEKFDNFDVYKTEFLEIQKEFLKNGITTVFEMNICSKEFTFWKKLSESGELKLDIIGYIKITTDKDVMDNNCKSYRKYKNHFRLGGYYISIDGNLSKKGAWLSKRYKGEKSYVGYPRVHEEQLSFLIKNVLAEKKQFVVETNGDNALDQFLRCFSENVKDLSDLERFRPIAKNCNFISKKHLKDMKNLGISPSFEIAEIKNNGERFKKILGIFRARFVQPVKMVMKNDMKFLLSPTIDSVPNIFELANLATDRTTLGKRKLGKNYEISFEEAMQSLIEYSSYFAFDFGIKGSIENGKRADFVVLDSSLDEILKSKNFDLVLATYLNSELVYERKN